MHVLHVLRTSRTGPYTRNLWHHVFCLSYRAPSVFLSYLSFSRTLAVPVEQSTHESALDLIFTEEEVNPNDPSTLPEDLQARTEESIPPQYRADPADPEGVLEAAERNFTQSPAGPDLAADRRWELLRRAQIPQQADVFPHNPPIFYHQVLEVLDLTNCPDPYALLTTLALEAYSHRVAVFQLNDYITQLRGWLEETYPRTGPTPEPPSFLFPSHPRRCAVPPSTRTNPGTHDQSYAPVHWDPDAQSRHASDDITWRLSNWYY